MLAISGGGLLSEEEADGVEMAAGGGSTRESVHMGVADGGAAPRPKRYKKINFFPLSTQSEHVLEVLITHHLL